MSGTTTIIVSGVVAVSLSVSACYAPDTETRTYRSPAGTYVVEARGAFGRPSHGFLRARVAGRVVKRGDSYAQLGVLREADRRNESFDELFSASVWETPNVLHFFDGSQSPGVCDTLVIANRSDATVKAVTIHAGDLILGFDIGSGAELKIPLAPAVDPAGRYVDVESHSITGEITRGSHELETEGMKGPIQFQIRLLHNLISILPARAASQSLRFKGRCSV